MFGDTAVRITTKASVHPRIDRAFHTYSQGFVSACDPATANFVTATYGAFRAINDRVITDSPPTEVVLIVRRVTGSLDLALSTSRALLADMEAQMSSASPDECDELEDKAIRVELGVRLLARYFSELAVFARENYFCLLRQRHVATDETDRWLEIFDLADKANKFLLEGIAGLRPEGPPH
jgi:hypothetical protein